MLPLTRLNGMYWSFFRCSGGLQVQEREVSREPGKLVGAPYPTGTMLPKKNPFRKFPTSVSFLDEANHTNFGQRSFHVQSSNRSPYSVGS